MIHAIEAVVEPDGRVRLLEEIRPLVERRALLILLDGPAGGLETALLSEAALARDWNRPEEDEAWSHLQQER